MRVVQLAVTEEALRILRSTRADFGRLPNPVLRGRIRGAASSVVLGTYDFSQVRAQSEYLRLVSIIEAYVDSCSSHLFDIRAIGKDIFFTSLITEACNKATATWEERKTSMLKHHGVKMTQCKAWCDIDAAREVRNSIAHGLGRLTGRQNNSKTRKKMEKVGIAFSGDALVIEEAALTRCTDSAVAFIEDLDCSIVSTPTLSAAPTRFR